MTHRLEDSPRRISFTVDVDITVGYHDCAVCGVECPPPTTEQLLTAAREFYNSAASSTYDPHWTCRRIALGELNGGGYLWPSSTEAIAYLPVGWKQLEEGLTCAECIAATEVALTARRKLKAKLCEP